MHQNETSRLRAQYEVAKTVVLRQGGMKDREIQSLRHKIEQASRENSNLKEWNKFLLRELEQYQPDDPMARPSINEPNRDVF